MTKEQNIAQLELAVMIARANPKDSALYIANLVAKLGWLAASLHKRYEAACSYEWANTDTYERRTEAYERQVKAIGEETGLTIEHQRDPRGWPLIIKISGNAEHRIG